MKFSIIFTLIALLFVSATYSATLVNSGDANISTPTNVFGSQFHTRNTAVSADTFSDTSVNKIYGPYALCREGGAPAAKYIGIKADAITGTTPQMTVKFQLINGTKITDTISSWTSCCQINGSAKDTVYDISAKVGKAIVFMVDNTDSTACQIPGLLEFVLKDASTEFIKLK